MTEKIVKTVGDVPIPGSPGGDSSAAAQESIFRLLVDSVLDYAIYMLDPAGNILTSNVGAERISGYTEEEVLGRHFSIFYPPENLHLAAHELAVAVNNGRYEEGGWRVRKDGSRFWANVILTPILDADNRLRGFAKVTRDLTAQRDLFEAEERFRLLVESVKDYAVFMLDPMGNVTSWNAGAKRIKGYTEEEIIGRHFSIFYTPEDIARNHPFNELKLALKEGSYEDEGWRIRRDGSRFWANVIITPVFERDGRLRGFAKVTRDMTHRREMEEQLKELNRQLESFAYSVAHDLRAPLRNIAFSSKLLLNDYMDKLDEEGRELLNTQFTSTTKLATVISDLLNLSRISRLDLKRQLIDLTSVAREVAQEVSKNCLCMNNVKIEVQSGMEVEADKTFLIVILQNLIDNAIKFSNGGTVTIGQERLDGRIVFFVRDEGVGFEMQYAEKIFQPFERLVRESESGGSGIGLANVRQAVAKHSGLIWAESELGKGATFYFTLS